MKAPKHLAQVRKLPCCVCGAAAPSDPHHLRSSAFGRGMGRKSGDEWVVPLCRGCHNRVHEEGSKREGAWFNKYGIEAPQFAKDLWEVSGDLYEMKRVLLRYLL